MTTRWLGRRFRQLSRNPHRGPTKGRRGVARPQGAVTPFAMAALTHSRIHL